MNTYKETVENAAELMYEDARMDSRESLTNISIISMVYDKSIESVEQDIHEVMQEMTDAHRIVNPGELI